MLGRSLVAVALCRKEIWEPEHFVMQWCVEQHVNLLKRRWKRDKTFGGILARIVWLALGPKSLQLALAPCPPPVTALSSPEHDDMMLWTELFSSESDMSQIEHFIPTLTTKRVSTPPAANLACTSVYFLRHKFSKWQQMASVRGYDWPLLCRPKAIWINHCQCLAKLFSSHDATDNCYWGK